MAMGKLVKIPRKNRRYIKPLLSKNAKKFVRKAVDSGKELKHLGTAATGVAINTTFTATPITLISQGDGSSERTGLTVKPSSIKGIIRVTRDSSATSSSLMRYRLFLVQWHMNSGDDAPDSLTDFLYETGTNPMMSEFHVKKSLRDKFTILWHTENQLGFRSSATTEGVPCSRIHHVNIRGKMRSIGYNSSATSGIGNIYLVGASEYAAGTDDGVMDYNMLVRYRDQS